MVKSPVKKKMSSNIRDDSCVALPSKSKPAVNGIRTLLAADSVTGRSSESKSNSLTKETVQDLPSIEPTSLADSQNTDSEVVDLETPDYMLSPGTFEVLLCVDSHEIYRLD